MTPERIVNLMVGRDLDLSHRRPAGMKSGATLLSVIPFLIWGTGVIKDFALAMVIGIIAGTYSSIYVAAPFTELIDSWLAKRQKQMPKADAAEPAKA